MILERCSIDSLCLMGVIALLQYITYKLYHAIQSGASRLFLVKRAAHLFAAATSNRRVLVPFPVSFHYPALLGITRTTDTQWRHKSKESENLGRCGRQNMLRPYLKIWGWDLIFGRAVKAISSLGVRSWWGIKGHYGSITVKRRRRRIGRVGDLDIPDINFMMEDSFWCLLCS